MKISGEKDYGSTIKFLLAIKSEDHMRPSAFYQCHLISLWKISVLQVISLCIPLTFIDIYFIFKGVIKKVKGLCRKGTI